MEPAGSGQRSPEPNTGGPENQDTASRTEDPTPRPETEPGSAASPGPGTTARGLSPIEDAEAGARTPFDDLDRELEETLRELELDDSVRTPARDRRSEMTPNRRVSFREGAPVENGAARGPPEGEAARGPARRSEIFQERVEAAARTSNMYGGPILGERVEMTPVALRRALDAAEIKIKQLERNTKKPNRFSTSSQDQSYYDPDRDHGGARAKLEKPRPFKGDYSELYNILNWLHAAERYLRQCRVRHEDVPGYIRSYTSRTVQAWLDGRFSMDPDDEPDWDVMREAMIERYLPPDHTMRLEIKFQTTVQRTTLLEYVELFQVLDSALLFAKMIISDMRKVLQFVKGLSKVEDRLFILERRPQDLNGAYEAVTTLRQAKTLASNVTADPRSWRSRSPKRSRELKAMDKVKRLQKRLNALQSRGGEEPEEEPTSKELKMLQGADKQKAWKEGACLNCGKQGHMIKGCPAIKKEVQRSVRRYTRETLKRYQQDPKKGKKPKRHLHKMDSQDEEAGAKESDESVSDFTSESSAGSDSESASENSDPES